MTGIGSSLVRDTVRAELPDLAADSIRRLGAGQEHVAYEVDGHVVVRFDLDHHGCSARIEREVALLRAVTRSSPLPVPEPLFVAPQRCCWGYRRLDGVPLLSLAPALRRRLASPVAAAAGELLAALHAIPIAELAGLAPADLQPPHEWLREAAEQYEAVAAHLPPGSDGAVRRFLDSPVPAIRDEPVFSHNDLGIEHILVDAASARVTGVIDWSDAAICDRAYDFGLLLRDLGPVALDAALGSYVIEADTTSITERARFYARCTLIEDLAYALETGRDEYRAKSLEALPALFT